MHEHLLSMGMCPVLSKEAALEIGVGNINLAIDFCDNEQTRERVRKEAQKVVLKTGLRSQGAKAASLRGLSAPAPADLVGNAAMGRKSSMALIVASTADSDAEESADEESVPLSARAEAARLSKQPWPRQAVSAVGKRGAAEDEEMRRDGRCPAHACTVHVIMYHAHTTRTPQETSLTRMPSSSSFTRTRPMRHGRGPAGAWMQRATPQRSQGSRRRARVGLLAAAARRRAPPAMHVRLRLYMGLPPPRQHLREVTVSVIVAAAAVAAPTSRNGRAS